MLFGPMRNYPLGACLLDRDDTSKLLGRMTYPLVRPDVTERKGYVPNVAYNCDALLHGRILVLPYAVADSFTTFATMSTDRGNAMTATTRVEPASLPDLRQSVIKMGLKDVH